MREHEAAEFQAILHRLAEAQVAGIARTHLVESCPSTQDVCRSLANDPTRTTQRGGLLVTALRQTSGRGRLGRVWEDPTGESMALTVSLPAREPARLSLRAGLAVCTMAENLGVSDVGLRWPNDVMVAGRKLSGILVEVSDGCAFLGIGINVLQSDWPLPLQDCAISLAQAGLAISRPRVLEACMRSLADVLTWQDECAAAAFTRFDLLRGTRQRFRVAHREIEGEVLEISPLAELVVQTPEGVVHIPALTASLIHDT